MVRNLKFPNNAKQDMISQALVQHNIKVDIEKSEEN
jgi:hypothetical protein